VPQSFGGCLSAPSAMLGRHGQRFARCDGGWGLLFPTAATAGADVPVGPGAHAVRSARAAGATVVDLTE
jgi:hypothetical protein